MIFTRVLGLLGTLSLVCAVKSSTTLSKSTSTSLKRTTSFSTKPTSISTKSSSTTTQPSGPTQSAGGQCGGLGWTGPTVCGLTYVCTYQNKYHSECLPQPTSTTSTTAPIPTVSAYGQCGGEGYAGPTVCEANTVCTYENEYHSQCIPGPNYTPPPYTPPPPGPTAASFNYMFSFGDDFTDTGFNLSGTKPAAGNQLGNPAYPGLTTAGGPNWVGDLINPNPHLLSYNFASRGATIDSSLVAPKVQGARSLVDQVAQFTSNLVPAPDYAPYQLNSTVFVFWIGSTDLNIAYKRPDWSTISQNLIDRYFEQVEKLYNIGARSFIFMNILPLQSTPAMLKESAATQKTMAAAVSTFNEQLATAAQDITTQVGGWDMPCCTTYTNFAFLNDVYSSIEFVIENPTKYNFKNASCYNPDGVSCLWTDPQNPGQLLQYLAGYNSSGLLDLYY